MPDEKPYLRPTEVAAKIGVHRNTIRNWCERGAIRGAIQTPTGRWLIPADWKQEESEAQ